MSVRGQGDNGIGHFGGVRIWRQRPSDSFPRCTRMQHIFNVAVHTMACSTGHEHNTAARQDKGRTTARNEAAKEVFPQTTAGNNYTCVLVQTSILWRHTSRQNRETK